MRVQFTDINDRRLWKWFVVGKFSLKFYYQSLNFWGVLSPWAHMMVSYPLKVKIIVWLALKHGLNIVYSLSHKEIQKMLVLCLAFKKR